MVLLDSAPLQEERATARAQPKAAAKVSDDSEPLYEIIDALSAFDRFDRNIQYDQPFDLAPGVRVTFVNAAQSVSGNLTLNRSGTRINCCAGPPIKARAGPARNEWVLGSLCVHSGRAGSQSGTEETRMSKKAAEHHKKAQEQHSHAARHHGEAAKHHEAGQHEKAAHHAHVARAHAIHARHYSEEATKAHGEEHGDKK